MKGFEDLKSVMLGGFIGDAAGVAFEFRKRNDFASLFKNEEITQYMSSFSHQTGIVSDDSQMSAFTLEGLISALRKNPEATEQEYEFELRQAYSNWLFSQGLENGLASPSRSYLLSQDIVLHRRNPGMTCISALSDMFTLMPSSARNDSRGCGAVMRVAPIGMLGYQKGWDEKKTFSLAECSAFITHNHPTAATASGLFAVLIQKLLSSTTLLNAANELINTYGGYSYNKAAVKPLVKAVKHVSLNTPPLESINDIGLGWTSEEALGIAVYCMMKASSFENLLYLSIVHDGDSDSTASMAGNLWGALNGMNGVRDYWIEENEYTELAIPLVMGLIDSTK
jgi:ADP-ribosylglycohydrolase